MPSFTARRAYRPRAFLVGLAGLAASVGAAFALGARHHAPVGWPIYVGMGGFMIGLIAMMIPRRVGLEVAGGRLVPSWRRAIDLEGGRVELGTWVLGGLDTAVGVVAHVRGRGGRLRIGGEQHAGDGYDLAGPASRSVDCQLPAADFDALVAALGVRRGAGGGPLVVPLVASSQSGGGILRMMAPWLVTILIVSGLGVALALTGVGERLTVSPIGRIAMTAVTVAIVIGGLVITMVRSSRVRAPGLELCADAHGLRLARAGGDEVAYAPWSAVRASPRAYRLGGHGPRPALPALELFLADYPLAVAAWDPAQAWPGEVERIRRAPGWLVGAPAWPRLIAELRRHRCLPPAPAVTSAR